MGNQIPVENEPSSKRQGRHSAGSIWVSSFLIALLFISFPILHLDYEYRWTEAIPAFVVVMIGAYRLGSAGVSQSMVFIYGCSTSLIFGLHFAMTFRPEFWMRSDNFVMAYWAISWVAKCVVLGFLAVGVAMRPEAKD